ncbi:UDP-glucuronosyltransferase 2B19 isoform X2 [Diachasma alloeum]|uniref:UDP-glucuronosyltransferase 2B19 isoform X2 n=1 Tax=Diachasma alloeum TaxID=454923 RepID=UPI00073848CA|nr:UDP-glucuronosyltransferase 2B19 isoform X2 [Diachasma alloeum]
MKKLLNRVIFLLALCFQCDLHNSLRILGVFPLPAKSHFRMYGRLMRELALREHQVDVIGRFPLKKPIPNYRDIVINLHPPQVAVNNISYTHTMRMSNLRVKHFARTLGVEICDLLSHPNMQDVMHTKKGAYDVIIVELLFADCYLALGQHLNAPIVGITSMKLPDWLLASFGNNLNPSYMPSVFSSSGQRMTFWERLQNTLLTNALTYEVYRYMETEVEHVERYFGRKLNSIKDLYNDVSIILVNEHYSIHGIRPTTPDIIAVGGLHVADDDEILRPDLKKWLDESADGCVYFTFGSMVKIETFPEAIVKIFYEMFERIAPVRGLIKIVDPTSLPPGLPKNVKTSSWLPQLAILTHKNVKLFITHGGLMGTQEAIAYKVPLVGLPLFGDQYANIGNYANKKVAIALSLEGLTADSLTNAVKTALNDPSYRNNIEKMSKLFWDRPMSAIDTAVYWIEYTARYGKELKSPAVELAWWEFYLIDVYGFLLMCLFVALYIITKIVAFTWASVIFNDDGKYSNNVSTGKKSQ